MQVDSSQLVPGCILMRDILGKTNRPIIPMNTVLTEQHITILEKFMVPTVEVAAKLQTGERFTPTYISNETTEEKGKSQLKNITPAWRDQYSKAVKQYRRMFTGLQNGAMLDIAAIRKLVTPLLKRVTEIGSGVFTLDRDVTKQNYFYHHSVAVGVLAAYIAQKMGYSKQKQLQIGLAGLLANCGMAKLDIETIQKEDELTAVERTEVRNHPTYAYKWIRDDTTIHDKVKLAVLQHHERLDGSGYPLGLTKQNIHSYARIIAVCDSYHAIICERPYQQKQSPLQAMEEILSEGIVRLDQQVVRTLTGSLRNFLIGAHVRLSNQKLAEIVFIEEKHPTKPIVKLDATGEVISLKTNTTLVMEEIDLSCQEA
ncbi:HD-GYP domain-containing protein [Lentibacillus sp. N15]|uniref:HD-GYP domain-containing protein n=1 Tax=Lentibacillus songyuanensis TaxID=3136161 RepID=UPI0031BAED6F